MPVKINNTFVKNVKFEGKQKRFMDVSESGFGLVVGAKKKTFVVIVRVRGKQISETLGYFPEISVDQARDKARVKKAAIREGGFGADSLQELVDRYFKIRGPELGEETRYQYNRIWQNRFFDWAELRPSDLTIEMCRKRHADISLKNGPIAANAAKIFLQSVITWSIGHGSLPQTAHNPWLHVGQNPRNPRRRWMQKDELARYWSALDELQKEGRLWQMGFYAIRYMLLSGRRKDEVLGLQWSMLDLAGATVSYPRTKTGPKTFQLAEQVVALFEDIPHLKDCEFVFASFGKSNTAINEHTLYKVHKEICKRAAISNLQVHDLRRTVGSQLLNSGVSLEDVSDLLGHEDVATTRRHYAHSLPSSKKGVAEDAASIMMAKNSNQAD
ncbi:MAG: site-specific integrase [Cohaesibacter sp.]|nr:site-specific integrase [Cohaesibacter sp.]